MVVGLWVLSEVFSFFLFSLYMVGNFWGRVRREKGSEYDMGLGRF